VRLLGPLLLVRSDTQISSSWISSCTKFPLSNIAGDSSHEQSPDRRWALPTSFAAWRNEGGEATVQLSNNRPSSHGARRACSVHSSFATDGDVAPRIADVLLAVPRMLFWVGVKEPFECVLYGAVAESVGVKMPRGGWTI